MALTPPQTANGSPIPVHVERSSKRVKRMSSSRTNTPKLLPLNRAYRDQLNEFAILSQQLDGMLRKRNA